jgi:MinD-like ATPase involved in chromosome partitioning or flagellar assembly
MVGDLAAGTRQPFFGWSNFAQIILIVVEPSAKSVLSAHRLARLVNRPLPEGEQPQKFAIIANKIRDESDLVELRQLLAETAVRNVPILSTIPYDKEAETAEQEGLAAIDSAPKSAVVQAIRELAVKLEKEIASSNYLVVQSV